jgi:hypothetical protein
MYGVPGSEHELAKLAFHGRMALAIALVDRSTSIRFIVGVAVADMADLVTFMMIRP